MPLGGSTEIAQTRDKAGSPPPDADFKPRNPGRLRRATWRYALRRTLLEIGRDNILDLAAGLTFYAVLSLFPALIAMVSLLGFIGQEAAVVQVVESVFADLLPAQVLEELRGPIEQMVQNPRAGIGLVVGILLAVFVASNYVSAFSRAMNQIYEVAEGRPIWRLKPLEVALTAGILVMVSVAAVLLVISGPLADAIGSTLGLGNDVVVLWGYVKLPVVLLLAMVVIALLYHSTPNIRQTRLSWLSPGAVLAIVIAVAASVGFSIVLTTFSASTAYAATYGTLASVITFLLWLYFLNVAVLLGAEFDSEVERARQLQAGIAAEVTIQLPPRSATAIEWRTEQFEKMVDRGEALREEGRRRERRRRARSSDEENGGDGVRT